MTDGKARRIAVAIVAVMAVAVAAIAVMRFTARRVAHVELDASRFPIRGLDISAHNGVPDFDSIAAAGFSFVYLKASEGNTHRDAAFMRNYLAAKRAGLKVGAYHFFRFDCDGLHQARNFLGATEATELDLPWAIDIEEWGNPADTYTDLIVERLESMRAIVEPVLGRCIVYTNKNGDARFMRGRYDAEHHNYAELWICSFTDPPLTRRPWKIWQHSHVGRVPGVKGTVDLNVFNGDASEWKRWLADS